MAKNNNTFKVPENYFNDLEKDILSKVNQMPKKKYIFSHSKAVFRYAAIALLLLAVGGIVWWNKPTDMAKTELANSINQTNNISSKEDINKPQDIKTEKNTPTKQKITTSESSNSNPSNEEQELSKEELEYLEYYLRAGVVNDYLTYNE